jgi:hypothetical protein
MTYHSIKTTPFVVAVNPPSFGGRHFDLSRVVPAG